MDGTKASSLKLVASLLRFRPGAEVFKVVGGSGEWGGAMADAGGEVLDLVANGYAGEDQIVLAWLELVAADAGNGSVA